MKLFQLFAIIFSTFLMTGCVGLYENQQPAPVFGRHSGEMYPPPSYPGEPYPAPPPETIQTRPLEGMNKVPEVIEMKPELPPPVESESKAIGEPSETTDPFAMGEQPETETTPESEPTPQNTAPAAPAVSEASESQELKPLETFAPQSPAVGSLMMAANDESQGGNLDSAVSSIERAIRIEPRNAALYYKLAVLRLKQSKPRLAEDLARKAALLAVNDNNLKKHSWLLIANAREQQNNLAGANKAKAEASKY